MSYQRTARLPRMANRARGVMKTWRAWPNATAITKPVKGKAGYIATIENLKGVDQLDV